MQKQTLWDLRVFCAVVEKNSFVAAARSLGISPSAATRAIQALEQQLGNTLLHRSQKLLSLSSAGEIYYGFAKQIVQMQDRAEDDIASLQTVPKGWVRFCAPEICSRFFLPQQLGALTERFPAIRLDVLYTDANLDPIQENLDFAIRGAFPADSELIGYPLWQYERILCASPAYVARKGAPQEPEELGKHALIVHTAPRILKDWHFSSAARTLRLHMQPTHRVNTGTGLYELIRCGAGIGRLADWVAAPAIRQGLLVRVCPAYRMVSASGQSAQMHAAYGAKGLPLRAKAILESIRQAAAQSMQSIY
ncbi:MAG: LysR family transcriptional regulator [Nitrosomonadales bacterium]|nr:LysR family transcriptional regulator [Nitrosomonadales bacterium]